MHKKLSTFFVVLLTCSAPILPSDKTAHDILATRNFAYVLAAGGAFIFAHGFGQYMGWISVSSQNGKPNSQPPVQGLEDISTTPAALTPFHRMAVGFGFTFVIAPLWYVFTTAAHKSINSPNGYLNYLGRLSSRIY